jgi:voltage-gated potassium channel
VDGHGTVRTHDNAYEIFILSLTILSLVLMVLLLLPLNQATRDAVLFFDTLFCVIFLADFAYNLAGSHPPSEYFIRRRGWLELVGSIPSFGYIRIAALLRLARVLRLWLIVRALGRQRRREILADLLRNRSEYAVSFTLIAVMLVLVTASIAILQFETADPRANIRTGGDALWWAFVTITTVGYGDVYPVTLLGRVTAVAVMFAGVGVIGALASILASFLVSAPTTRDEETDAPASPATAARLEAMQQELVAIRRELAALAHPTEHRPMGPPEAGTGTVEPPDSRRPPPSDPESQ